MAEYSLRIYRLDGRFPEQYVLYVGNAKVNTKSELTGRDVSFRYKLVDIRSVDEDSLINSPSDADNIIAI